ncbi:phage tail protein [Cellulomonas sp. NPDC055163]
MLALQRSAGNAAVSALMAAKQRGPDEAATGALDAALRELTAGDPAIDVVEKGLKAAQATGVPVTLEGPKPPAAALAVTTTGFGPESVAPKKPVPPPKQVPPTSPLGKAAATKVRAGAGPRPAAAPRAPGGAPAARPGASALSGDQVLAPPVPPTGTRPQDDPAFARVAGSVGAAAHGAKAHAPAAAKAKEAQDAALAPVDDVAGQAKAAKIDAMDAQQPGTFDKKAFIAAVKAAIEAKSPKSLQEADDYTASGKAGQVKGDVQGLVAQGKDGQAKDVAAATEAPPDPSRAVPKPVTPLPPEQPGTVPPVPAAGAVPKPAPPDQLNLAGGTAQADAELAGGGVTEEQLARSNEPAFQSALADKKAAAAHADTAPAAYRAQEAQVLAQGRAEAAGQTAQGLAGMQGARTGALANLVAAKGATKSKDEVRRAEVTARVQGIFAATEADVKKLLDGLDPKVETAFDTGEKAARTAFETFVAAKMSAYKQDRYSGWLGGLRWAKDKLVGMPAKVDEFYTAGRELYLRQMDGVISRVADVVAADLTAAKQRIAAGRAEIASYVKTLPSDLAKVGSEASTAIGEKFEQLESDVNDKQDAVVDTLATKYTEARSGLDERITALQAENKGFVDKAIGAIKDVVGTIRELAAMLTGVLARAAGVVGDILKDPVAFLGNLVAGVKGGILKFRDKILDHLRKGLMGWLFGALAEGGVELPDTFDVKGVVKLLASLFGLTWANIRNRIVRKIGAAAMGAVEKGVQIFQVLSTQGVGGLWQMLVEKLGDLKEMILEKVRDFVITKVITAGVTWLISMLNPAAAFIKACKLIYDVVMFFVTNAGRLATFVNTVIDSVADVVRGNVSGVVDKINDVLGQMVPILIGFLASVIGLGGVGEKIRQIVQTLQKPVNKALDVVITTGLKLAGPLIRGAKRLGGKLKAKLRGGDDSPEGKQQRLDKGMAAGLAAVRRFSGRGVSQKVLTPLLAGIRVRYGLTALEPVQQGKVWAVHGAVNPTRTTSTGVLISDELLRKSVEAMHGRVHGVLKEGKRWAQGNGRPTAVVTLETLRTAFEAEEPRFRRLAALSPAEQLALRDVYTRLDSQGDAVLGELERLDKRTEALQQVHDQTRTTKSDLAKLVKKSPHPAWAGFIRDYEAAETSYQALWKSGDDNAIAAARVLWDALHARSEAIRVDVEKPADLALERVTAKADAALASSATLVEDTRLSAAQRKELVTARTELTRLRDGAQALTAPAPSALLPLSQAADALTKLAGGLAPRPEVPADARARALLASIAQVIRDASPTGRPHFRIGTGTTEDALEHEREHGLPIGTREGHPVKLRESITSLAKATAELTTLEPSLQDEALRSTVRGAVRDADARRALMETEYAAWERRLETQKGPEGDRLWFKDADGVVRSKLVPTWPSTA